MDHVDHLFLDANIFFAAAASQKGGSFLIVELAKRGLILAITSAHALSEAERNISKKLGTKALERHRENLLEMRWNLYVQSVSNVKPWQEEMALTYLPEKDVPILLGAMESMAKFLITLDGEHFLKNLDLKDVTNEFLTILTPGDYLQKYFKK